MLRQRFAALAVLALLTAGVPAAAQVSLATVTGVVTDSAMAVIPGASVTITNVLTGIESEAETN